MKTGLGDRTEFESNSNFKTVISQFNKAGDIFVDPVLQKQFSFDHETKVCSQIIHIIQAYLTFNRKLLASVHIAHLLTTTCKFLLPLIHLFIFSFF